MLKIDYDGIKFDEQVVTLEYDTVNDAADAMAFLTHSLTEANQTLTLNITYWRLLWLASMVERQNPKKAKWLRKVAEHHNPLRLIGLLPKK